MAKVIITIEDAPDGPTARVTCVPPLVRDATLTDAQELAMQVAQWLAGHPDRESLKVECQTPQAAAAQQAVRESAKHNRRVLGLNR